MAELIAKTPLARQAPLVQGALVLAEWLPGQMTSVALYNGQDKAMDRALEPLSLRFPGPNEVSSKGDIRLVWTGRGQAFLIGAPAGDWSGFAALTDQSDGWAGLSLMGPGAVEVLARLVPLDLRHMAVGQCARSSLGHMPLILIAVSGGFQILTFRSMAKTAWHELATAMTQVAARALLEC